MTSKTILSFDDQLPLSFSRPPEPVDVPLEMIRAKRTQGAAFTLACDASSLDDKEIYLALKIDAATFSRMKKGDNTLPGDRIREFCQVVGNVIYPRWLAYQVDCALVLIKSEAERQRDEAIERAIRAEDRAKLLQEILAGRAVG